MVSVRVSAAVLIMVVASFGCMATFVDGRIVLTVQGQVIDNTDDSPLDGVAITLIDRGLMKQYGATPWDIGHSDHSGMVHVQLNKRYAYVQRLPFINAPGKGTRGKREERFAIKLSKEGYESKRIEFKGSELSDHIADLGVVRLECIR